MVKGTLSMTTRTTRGVAVTPATAVNDLTASWLPASGLQHSLDHVVPGGQPFGTVIVRFGYVLLELENYQTTLLSGLDMSKVEAV